MAHIKVEASAQIDAPAERVYALIADYHNGHPTILPKRYFSDLTVEKGGYGAGTQIRFTMHLMGQTHHLEAVIEEPKPGRLLTETVRSTGGVTSFLVEPTADEGGCTVTITTEWDRSGVMGWLERLSAPPLLKRVYREELDLIAQRAHEQVVQA